MAFLHGTPVSLTSCTTSAILIVSHASLCSVRTGWHCQSVGSLCWCVCVKGFGGSVAALQRCSVAVLQCKGQGRLPPSTDGIGCCLVLLGFCALSFFASLFPLDFSRSTTSGTSRSTRVFLRFLCYRPGPCLQLLCLSLAVCSWNLFASGSETAFGS